MSFKEIDCRRKQEHPRRITAERTQTASVQIRAHLYVHNVCFKIHKSEAELEEGKTSCSLEGIVAVCFQPADQSCCRTSWQVGAPEPLCTWRDVHQCPDHGAAEAVRPGHSAVLAAPRARAGGAARAVITPQGAGTSRASLWHRALLDSLRCWDSSLGTGAVRGLHPYRRFQRCKSGRNVSAQCSHDYIKTP